MKIPRVSFLGFRFQALGLLLKLSDLTASVFKVGYLPKAPGTWGSLVGLGLWYAYPAVLWIPILFVIGWGATWYILPSAPNKDPSFIVIDEVVGMMLTLMLMGRVDLKALGIGFILFRVFDIFKPFPIHWVDHYFEVKNSSALAAFGVMIDDIIAGIFAGILGSMLLVLWP